MFGFTKFNTNDIFYQFSYFFDKKVIILCVVGVIGATLFSASKLKKIVYHVQQNNVGLIVQEVVLFGLMIVSVICMINSTYSPFIYFRY